MLNKDSENYRYPTMPMVESDNHMPLNELALVADSHACEIWGKNVARGQPLPVADAKGDTIALAFPYIKRAGKFPAFDHIFKKIQGFSSQIETLNSSDDSEAVAIVSEIQREASQYGSIYVSTVRTGYPLLMISHYLHAYFLNGQAAQAIAEKLLASEKTRLGKIYFLGIHEEYFEFATRDNRVLLNMYSLQHKSDTALVPARDTIETVPLHIQKRYDAVWERALGHAPVGIDAEDMSEHHTEKRIAHWKMVPEFVHTYWCVPTSEAMILGFWDNFVKGEGTVSGYGRLIGYWFDHARCHNPATGRDADCSAAGARHNNAPDLIDQIIDPKTGTWRKGFKDMADFIEKTYGYEFQHDVIENVNSSNDWAWDEVKKEVNAGRPAFWSFDKHMVVAIGYRITHAGQKLVIYLDTYGTTHQAKLKEIDYSKCNGFQRVVPGGGTNGQHLILVSPDGDNVLQAFDAFDISWFVWGNEIQQTTIEASTDGGRNWALVAQNINTKTGWNTYSWVPAKATAKGRIRVKGYKPGHEYVAGDGSSTQFKVEPASLDEVDNYRIGWKHDIHTGLISLQFKDGRSLQLDQLSYKSYRLFLDTLRNEQPVWYDRNQGLLFTYQEPIGEREHEDSASSRARKQEYTRTRSNGFANRR